MDLRPDRHEFTVVLHNQPIFDTPDPAWERHVRTLPVNTRQMRILVAHPSGSFTNAQYQALNQVDRDLAYREIQELVGLGILESSGLGGRGARYWVLAAPRTEPQSREPAGLASLKARMKAQGFIKANDVRDLLGVNRYRATAILAAWVRQKAVVREGRTAARKTGQDRIENVVAMVGCVARISVANLPMIGPR